MYLSVKGVMEEILEILELREKVVQLVFEVVTATTVAGSARRRTSTRSDCCRCSAAVVIFVTTVTGRSEEEWMRRTRPENCIIADDVARYNERVGRANETGDANLVANIKLYGWNPLSIVVACPEEELWQSSGPANGIRYTPDLRLNRCTRDSGHDHAVSKEATIRPDGERWLDCNAGWNWRR